jgi:hypothetical protein
MPEEAKPGDDTHEIDQDDGRELDVAGALSLAGIEPHEKVHDSKLFQEVEELVEQPGFSKSIDLGDFLAFGKILGDSSLVSGCSAPGESLSNFSGGLGEKLHGNVSL